MAGDTTPPGGATRYIETTRGLLTYAQLAPLLAERVLRVERAIASGDFASQPLASDLILRFHSEIAGDLVPEWAGRWCTAEVRVGLHHPPPPPAGEGVYFAALRAGDERQWRPLMQIWEQRFEQFSDLPE